MGGCLSSRRWWAFLAHDEQLFCKIFSTNKNEKKLVYPVILMSPKLKNTVVISVAF
jgi:hypothetical protein